jgi:hypothetical protein
MLEIGDKKMFLDSVFAENEGEAVLVLNKKYQDINKNLKSTLFSRGRRTESFFTEDSRLYVTPREQKMMGRGIKINAREARFDSLSSKIVSNYRQFRPKENDFLYKKLSEKYEEIRESFANLPQNFASKFSLTELWNFSLVTAIIIGMVSKTFIYRYLGAGVSADDNSVMIANIPATQVLGTEEIKNDEETVQYIQDIINNMEESKKEEFNNKVEKMVKGYPIEKMLPYILEKDQIVVAFLVGIAKKESGWGVHVPLLDGRDCYNYWGYRGQRVLMGTGGHTCFNSREDAVDTVSKRIEFLIEEKKLDTPAKMSIWKCGSACDEDGQVGKWISDVSMYFEKLN